MNPSVTLGRIAGVRISINWSWLVVFALIVWTLASAVFPAEKPHLARATYLGMAVVAAFLFFASLLLHELGHAFQARREGMEIEGITLWLFGGIAQFKGMFSSAGAELRIALAGPIVSLFLGGMFVTVALVGGLGAAVDGVAAWLGYINLMLLAFNLLPALPLDGGRVLRALLWRARGDFSWATRIAAAVGRGFGYLLVALGIFLLIAQGVWSGVWLAFIGWFLLQAAAAEGRYGLLREALGGLYVRDPVTVAADASIAEFMDDVVHAHRFTTYPVVDDGHVLGLLPFASVARVPRGDWERKHVRECMLAFDDVPRLREDEALVDALGELATEPPGRALVLDGGQVVGLLSISDVGRLVAAAGTGSRRGGGRAG